MTHLSKPKAGLALLLLLAGFLLAGCKDSPADLIRSARDYQAKGDHPAAIIQLKNVLQQQPDNGEARLMLGRSNVVIGDAATAEKEFRKALEYGQAPATVVPLIAEAMLQGGHADKVVSEFGAVKLDDALADAELKARVGEAQLRTGNRPEAEKAFSSALAVAPGNVRAQLGQARLSAIDGKLDEASSSVEKIAAAHPDSADALLLHSELKLARGDRSGAIKALELASAAAPATPTLRFQLISLMIADGQFDAAKAQVAAARAVRANNVQLQYFEAVIALAEKDLARARDLSQQVLKKAPSHVPAMVLAGAVELQDKNFTQAATQLQNAVALAPNHMGARTLLARSYLASNQPARALEAMRPIIDSGRPLEPATAMLAGEATLANGNLKQAAGFFEAAATAKGQGPLARTRLGQIAMISGDVEGGIRDLEVITADDAAPLQAQLALLAAYVRQGNTGKALELARDLVKKRPDDPLVHNALGSVLLVRKDTAGARAAFSKALELNPTYMPAVASLAQLDLRENKTADARARFEGVLTKEPNNEIALLGLAEVLARSRAPAAEIAAVLQRAITAQPQSVNARVALVNLHLNNRDARAALAAAQDASATLGQDARVLDALGRAQLASGESNQAIETFKRLAAADPKSPQPLVRLASAYIATKEFKKAVEALQRAQKIAPRDVTVARDLVAVNMMMEMPDEAVKQARALQAAVPNSASGFVLEGDVHAASRKWTAAEKAYRDGLKAEPASRVAAVKLHGALLASNKKAEADGFARKWVADHSNDIGFREYFAEQALRARDYKTAIAQYKVVVAQQPDNPVALNNLAWALGQIGDPTAVEYAERALRIAPESPAILDTLGVILTAKGDGARASEHLSRAVALAPDRHDIRLNYAKALMKAGRIEDARKELTRLQAVGEDFQGKSEVAELLKK